MLYHLLVPLTKAFSPFNVFRYVTFRTAGAFLTALVVCLILGPPIIRKLTAARAGQVVRDDGPQSHLKKAGTPIGSNDVWIAAGAMQHGLPILTSDTDFQKIPQVIAHHFPPA